MWEKFRIFLTIGWALIIGFGAGYLTLLATLPPQYDFFEKQCAKMSVPTGFVGTEMHFSYRGHHYTLSCIKRGA